MARGNRLQMAQPRMGKMSIHLCGLLSCVEQATHWVDDGRGDDTEYCERHATLAYEEAMEEFQDIQPPDTGAMSDGTE
jgi:hypothetical protein